MESISYDHTGKVNMSGIYDNRSPLRYFSTLDKLDYQIPEAARPIFEKIIRARRAAYGEKQLKVVDLGCSYGVNAALLKHGQPLGELFQLYNGKAPEGRDALIERDREELFAEPADPKIEFVGVDSAENAIDYAVEAGLLDSGLATDLEREEPGEDEAELIAGTGLIISTGCYGYVTEVSLERLLDAAGGKPWMAHCVLRMFDFSDAEAMLKERGYVTEKVPGLLRQRRFASMEEREKVLKNVKARGLDPKEAEQTGWYFAEMFVSRPREDARKLPLAEMLA